MRRPAASPPAPTRLIVPLGARRYPVYIGRGLLQESARYLAPLLARPFCAIVSDTSTARHHLPLLRASLTRANIGSVALRLPDGEASKSFAALERVCRFCLRHRLERRDLVLALGGGMVGDIAGLAAALTRRGCGLVQMPTTLLAQIDSAIGGKTAINTAEGKNLVGSFHQPRLVLSDSGTLDTLPVRQLRAGYAEMVKYAALGDARFFGWLEKNGHAVLQREPAALTRGIATSCRHKARIVAADERDEGERALLNLGHSFGHALEALCGYRSALLHGEAVALGMQLAFDFSVQCGLCPPEDAARLAAHLKAVGLPHRLAGLRQPQITAANMVRAMRQDKKTEGGALTLILVRGLGRAFVARQQNWTQLRRFLQQQLKG